MFGTSSAAVSKIDATIQTTNLAASRLREISRKDVLLDIETGPGCQIGMNSYNISSVRLGLLISNM